MKNLSTLALSCALIFALTGCERPKAAGMQKPPEGPIPVSVIQVQSGNFPHTLNATGQTQAFNTVQVYARVNGYLSKRAYAEGSKVQKGETLFTIDPSDLKNSLQSAKAAYELASANHTNAVAILNRIKPLAAANASSQQDLDTAKANERNTNAAVMSAKALLDQATLNLSYTTIKSPINGYVDRSKVDVGTYVTPGANALLTTVYQTDPLYVNFTLSENDRLHIQNALASGKLILPHNNAYTITLTLGDGTTLKRTGKVDFIAPFVDASTGNVTYRAVVDNQDHLLLPGQFVKVSVQGMEWKDVLYVPQKTLLSGEKGKFVYAIEANNTVTPKLVNAQAWIGDKVIIDGEITLGTQIASDGLAKLKPGGEIVPPKHQ